MNNEVEKALKDIDLTSKRNTPAGKLSGGQKRKLSIGIALIGDPKVSLNMQNGMFVNSNVFTFFLDCFLR